MIIEPSVERGWWPEGARTQCANPQDPPKKNSHLGGGRPGGRAFQNNRKNTGPLSQPSGGVRGCPPQLLIYYTTQERGVRWVNAKRIKLPPLGGISTQFVEDLKKITELKPPNLKQMYDFVKALADVINDKTKDRRTIFQIWTKTSSNVQDKFKKKEVTTYCGIHFGRVAMHLWHTCGADV